MMRIMSKKSAPFTLLSLVSIHTSTSFTITPTPLQSLNAANSYVHHNLKNTCTITNTNRHLHQLFAESNSDDQIGTTKSDGDEVDSTATAPKPVSQSQAVLDEASDALQSVGWSSPMSEDEELTSDDPFVKMIDAQIFEENGVGLDGLLNPAKVVNLERDLFNLRTELALLTGKPASFDVTGLTTDECDGGIDGGDKASAIRKKIEKKEQSLFVERRAVFRDWLKTVFLGQAVLSLGLSYVMVTNPATLFGGFDWFQSNSMDVSIKVLGFWWWWLFIVPSLRSRRPTGFEKKALDIAFLGTPAISITAPIFTKDQFIIWSANLAVVFGSYVFAYLTYDGQRQSGKDVPEWLKFIYSSLDFGSGKERGIKK